MFAFIRRDWQLAILSGLLVGLAYPPLKLGFLAWFGFLPLIHVLLRVDPRSAMRLGYLAGVFANLVSLYWIGFNSGAGFITVFASLLGAVLYLAIYWGLFALVLTWLQRKLGIGLVLWPLLWVTMEYIRSFGAMGFPWINLATTQVQYLPLIQMAEITGSYGISFWVILLNIALYIAALERRYRFRLLVPLGLALIMSAGAGQLRIRSLEQALPEQVFSAAIVQPNLNPNDKWESSKREFVFDLMDSTLVEALRLEPQLVVWPESAVPAYLRLNGFRRKKIVSRLAAAGIPLLTGAVDKDILDDGTQKLYNGSLLLRPDGKMETYNKIHLVPFAEYIPLSGTFPILEELNFGQGNFDQGDKLTVFEVDSVRFSNLICYESAFPQLVRRFVQAGAQFLTIETNDAWVGHSSGPYQHFALAVLRAVENRIAIVRCANTGISGFINPSGVVTASIPLDQAGIIINKIPVRFENSFYTRYGDVFSILCIFVTLISVGLEWKRKFSRQSA
ncbi:MAG: apolipoprotein N-acyltransferase [Candidatus Neomarinimicrobiota bacterium]